MKEAMEKAKKSHPEFAILDVMLPDGNGFDLMEQLMQVDDYPILFLTARGEDDDKSKGFGLGANDYIINPFLPKELLFRVMAILRRSYKAKNPFAYLHDSRIDFSCAEASQILLIAEQNLKFCSRPQRKALRNGGKNDEHIPLTVLIRQ